MKITALMTRSLVAALLCAGLLSGCGGDNGKKSDKEDRTEERRTRAERVREYLNALERRISDLEQENSLQQSKIEQARRELGIVRAEIAAAAARHAAAQKSGEGPAAGAGAETSPARVERDKTPAQPEPEARRELWVTVVLLAFITFVALYGLKLWRDQEKQKGDTAAGATPYSPPPGKPEAPPPDTAKPDTDNYVKLRPPSDAPESPSPADKPVGPPDPWAAGDAAEDAPEEGKTEDGPKSS
ncbi:MAG: hypothetical protein N2111_09810 [Candidatus Sumerlaeaceae bacterium]|nr:hypothetical protein [Candidatus Sumerlaeaceae bacterium]